MNWTQVSRAAPGACEDRLPTSLQIGVNVSPTVLASVRSQRLFATRVALAETLYQRLQLRASNPEPVQRKSAHFDRDFMLAPYNLVYAVVTQE